MGSQKNKSSVLRNTWNGLKENFKTEFSLHLIIGGMIITFGLAIFLNCNYIEWIFLIFFLGVMFAVELFNSSIEKIVDLKTKEYHPLAKAAKDTASAAECVVCLTNILGILFILLPKIIEYIMW